MKYIEAIDYLFRQLPMYQRVGPKALKLDLGNIIQLCKALDNPEDGFQSIHIAGTNGKGTSAHLLAAALQADGLKVGLYTSPHYKDFRERVKINGEMISKRAVVRFVKKFRNDLHHIKASFFEMSVALAFEYFKEEKVDIAIIETGLGGRLDSTNIISPIMSLITNISLDHQATLGDTLSQIANEKAGIIKPGIPVVIGEKNDETIKVFKQAALSKRSKIIFAEERFSCKVLSSGARSSKYQIWQKESNLIVEIDIPVQGAYQSKNLISSLAALELLSDIWEKYHFDLTFIAKAWKDINKLTNYQGRWQILNQNPLIIADSAHNPAGWLNVLKSLSDYETHQIHFVLGFSGDKDLRGILSTLPKNSNYYFLKANVPRGMEVNKLASLALEYNLNGGAYSSPHKALETAKRNAKDSDVIFIGGSVFTVAEFL